MVLKKRAFTIIAAICVFLIVALTVLLNSNYYYAVKLVDAIEEQDVHIVKTLITKKPACANTFPSLFPSWWRIIWDYHISHPLFVACETGNVEIVKMLVEAGADVNYGYGDIGPPLWALYVRKPENWYQISVYLIENGALVDYTYGNGKIYVLNDIIKSRPGAALSGYIPDDPEEVRAAFEYALEHIPHDNVDWPYLLCDCAVYERIEIMQLLLDQGYCDVNEGYGENNVTPLIFAAWYGEAKTVQFLLDSGANPYFVDSEGMTAYDHAVQCKNDDAILILESYSQNTGNGSLY